VDPGEKVTDASVLQQMRDSTPRISTRAGMQNDCKYTEFSNKQQPISMSEQSNSKARTFHSPNPPDFS
jgi:hypothetical protein